MDEALEEHHVAHVLIKELKRMKIRDGKKKAKKSNVKPINHFLSL